MAIITSNPTVEYDANKPIKETIKATGRFVVTSASAACEAAELVKSGLVLARATLQESIIEAQVDAKTAELSGLDKLAELEAQLEAKRAQLAKA